MVRERSNAIRGRALVFVGLLSVLAAAEACTSRESECTSDSDCPARQECVSAGGVLTGGGICVAENSERPSGPDAADTSSEVDAAPGATCDFQDRPMGVCADLARGDAGGCPEPPNYQADETSCDGVDNDCDGEIDEGCSCTYDGDGDGEISDESGVCLDETKSADGECSEPDEYIPPTDDESSTGENGPHCDDLDNDCDGETDEGCPCEPVGKMETCGTDQGACESGTRECTESGWSDCMGDDGPSAETCNEKDDDCNGTTDENLRQKCSDQEGVCTGSETTCESGEYECEASDYGPDYERTERSCGDGKDNNCDGRTDCADLFCNGRSCAGTGTGCSARTMTCQETRCGDGIDNEGDGDTDCGDGDCTGETCNGAGTACTSGTSGCHETDCTNGSDDDGDGLVDCADGDCLGQGGCDHRMFVTSAAFEPGQAYSGQGSPPYRFQSISDGDAACNALAGSAGLSGTWRTLLSTSMTDARDHLTVNGNIYNLDNTLIAKGTSELWVSMPQSSNLRNAVQYDETGSKRSVMVWTGTQPSGEWDGATEMDGSPDLCSDWSSASAMEDGEVGYSSRSDHGWIIDGNPAGRQDNLTCDQTAHLYCIDGP